MRVVFVGYLTVIALGLVYFVVLALLQR